MKRLPLHIPLLLVAAAAAIVSAGKRTDVVVSGPTEPPGFSRQGGQLSTKCFANHTAFSSGALCCAKNYKSRDADDSVCPGRADNPFLLYSDPEQCCRPEDTFPCPGEVCSDNLDPDLNPNNRFQCPYSHPAALERGLACCRYQLRGAGCPTGNEGERLEASDPYECCHGGQAVDCQGGVGRCVDNMDSINTYCPLLAGSSGKHFWDMGVSQTVPEAKATCAAAGRQLVVLRSEQDHADALAALSDPASGTHMWINGANGQAGAYEDATCTADHFVFEDAGGAPFSYAPWLHVLVSTAATECLQVHERAGDTPKMHNIDCTFRRSNRKTICFADCGN